MKTERLRSAVRGEITRLLQTKMDQALHTRPDATTSDKADLLLQYGGTNPPSGKGQSDSFFIKTSMARRPLCSSRSKARPATTWRGRREAAPGRNPGQQIDRRDEEDADLDFGVAKTTLFKTDDDKFTSGSISKSSKRSGAATSVSTRSESPSHADGLFESRENTNIKEFYDSLNSDDIENMAILDFATLNFDRHSDNVLSKTWATTPAKPVSADRRRADAPYQRRVPHRRRKPTCRRRLRSKRNRIDQRDEEHGHPVAARNRPFSQRAKNAIAQMDPEALT